MKKCPICHNEIKIGERLDMERTEHGFLFRHEIPLDATAPEPHTFGDPKTGFRNWCMQLLQEQSFVLDKPNQL